MTLKDETIQAYDKAAPIYAKKFNDIGSRSADVERAVFFINKKNPKVVEIGCGNGRDAKEILKFTNDYTGIDASKEMIKLAKEYLSHANFLVADLETFTYPDNLDIVFAFASLLHCNREVLSNILEKLYAALNSGGIIYISVKKGDYQEKIKTDEFGSRAFYFYTAKDFQDLASGKYEVIYTDEQLLRGTDWLTVALRKLG